jgi:hypothetical protein
MTLPIFDPDDASIVALWNATIGSVHPASRCAGQWCVIHNPSDHPMRDFPLYWRNDVYLMERICPHGVGHPDPDDVAFQDRIGRHGMGIHGCDGCGHTRLRVRS